MNSSLLAALLVVAGYLVGAIPFGYLFARWLKGIDVRQAGSGNYGATNVGRVLGFRFFWPVFLFDMLKGVLPTLGAPLLFERLTELQSPADLSVLVALATILGHNFPVYLNFRGGKGVATSLGAFFALDPVAGTSAAIGFVAFLVVTRYVSLSSIGGALVYCLTHFSRIDEPWARKERGMTFLTIALLVLLILRHRTNLSRLRAGTEPKINFTKRRDHAPGGRIATSWLMVLAAFAVIAAGGAIFWTKVAHREILTIGPNTLTEVHRTATGHQRAERVAFAHGGRLLAVTCPRYNQLVLYRVTKTKSLEPLVDLALEGKPVAVCAAADRLYVLERPSGDERHVAQGWWETFDFQGARLGEKVIVGFYPDDMALSPDGRCLYVLTSGRAEGDSAKPLPALDAYDLGDRTGPPKSLGRVTFDGPRDDPSRVSLSASGRCAVVTLQNANEAASVDLFDPASPRHIGRSSLASVSHPYSSWDKDDAVVMPAESGQEAVALQIAGAGDCVAYTLPHGSGIEIQLNKQHRSLGTLTLHGGLFGVGTVRPTGLAFSPERGLIAVTNRSGGVHLVAIHAAEEIMISDRIIAKESGTARARK